MKKLEGVRATKQTGDTLEQPKMYFLGTIGRQRYLYGRDGKFFVLVPLPIKFGPDKFKDAWKRLCQKLGKKG